MVYFDTALLLIIIGLLLWRMNLSRSARAPGQSIILDSCALIDGRIIDIYQAGFLSGQLVIPEFIVAELQLLADGKDAYKRERARFGLEIAKQLRALPGGTVLLAAQDFRHLQLVDDKLVALAQHMPASLYTTDFNLGKVAAIKGVAVLNVNELAQRLRPSALPGEQVTVTLIRKGQGKNQAVGYLEDGTMVVVDDAQKLIGKTVAVTVMKMHQSVSGKMIFAHAQRG
ncbi:MAG: TRAM domain-containing protein [Candidatus Saccharibacteria bacterium]